MSIYVSEGDKNSFIPCPAGTHQAVCFDIWDIGIQKSTYQNKEIIQHKGIIAFEISETMTEGKMVGKRFCLYKKYTFSLNDKATLRHDLESWRGMAFSPAELKEFDIEKLIGINCLLSVVHEKSADGKKIYANIKSISKMIGGMTPLLPENPRSLPDWIIKLRQKAENAEMFEAAADFAAAHQTDADDTIPF